jgi:hypothetical protein
LFTSLILYSLNPHPSFRRTRSKMSLHAFISCKENAKKLDSVLIFWDITPCSAVKVRQRFRGTYCLHLQSWRVGQESSKQGGGMLRASLTLRPWWWRRYVPPKRQWTFTGVTSQEMVLTLHSQRCKNMRVNNKMTVSRIFNSQEIAVSCNETQFQQTATIVNVSRGRRRQAADVTTPNTKPAGLNKLRVLTTLRKRKCPSCSCMYRIINCHSQYKWNIYTRDIHFPLEGNIRKLY